MNEPIQTEFKCLVCGVNSVQNEGDICDICMLGADPYLEVMKNDYEYTTATCDESHPEANTELLQASSKATITSSEQKLHNPAYAQNANEITVCKDDVKGPLSAGIVKNITKDYHKKLSIKKWANACFKGTPISLDDEVTMFQIFPDYNSSMLNKNGNNCDQIIVYGTIREGAISEYNEVEVYGNRDSNNNIVAKRIINSATGTRIKPEKVLSPMIIRVLTLLVLLMIPLAIWAELYGAIGISFLLFLCIVNFAFVKVLFNGACKLCSFAFKLLWDLVRRIS